MADEQSIKKFRKLTESLYAKTETGGLDWSESITPGSFQVRIGSNIVIISQVSTGATIPDYEVQIVKPYEYTLIDSYRDTDIYNESQPEVMGFPSYFKMMEAMYNSIQRKLSGADQAIDEILDFLK